MKKQIKVFYANNLSEEKIKRCRELAKKYPDHKPELYICGQTFNSAITGETFDYYLNSEEQGGFKTAEEKIPYFEDGFEP